MPLLNSSLYFHLDLISTFHPSYLTYFVVDLIIYLPTSFKTDSLLFFASHISHLIIPYYTVLQVCCSDAHKSCRAGGLQRPPRHPTPLVSAHTHAHTHTLSCLILSIHSSIHPSCRIFYLIMSCPV
jgi:hypothetical protein